MWYFFGLLVGWQLTAVIFGFGVFFSVFLGVGLCGCICAVGWLLFKSFCGCGFLFCMGFILVLRFMWRTVVPSLCLVGLSSLLCWHVLVGCCFMFLIFILVAFGSCSVFVWGGLLLSWLFCVGCWFSVWQVASLNPVKLFEL